MQQGVEIELTEGLRCESLRRLHKVNLSIRHCSDYQNQHCQKIYLKSSKPRGEESEKELEKRNPFLFEAIQGAEDAARSQGT